MADDNPVDTRSAGGPAADDAPPADHAPPATSPPHPSRSAPSGSRDRALDPSRGIVPGAAGAASDQVGGRPGTPSAAPAGLSAPGGPAPEVGPADVVGPPPVTGPASEVGRGAEPTAVPEPGPGSAGTAGSGAGQAPPGGRRAARPERRKGSFLRELPVLLIIAFGLAVVIKTFLVQAFFIPSGSMEQTLHGCPGCSGDRVLVNKLVYRFHDPRPGDIVVFRGPESWAPEARYAAPTNPVQRALRAVGSAVGIAPPGEKDFIKRVIAVGGQTVQCCDRQGRVTVDGRPLDEPYVFVSDQQGYEPPPFGPITVPAGRLWMMGDHRDQSADSRIHVSDPNEGTISDDDVVGKSFAIVWPPSRWDTLGTPATFSSASAGAGAGGPAPVSGIAALATPYLLGLGGAAPVLAVRRRRRRRRGGR